MDERTVAYEIERLRKRVAALEVRDTKLMTERLDDFQWKLNHMYVQICKRVGVIDMPQRTSEPRPENRDSRAGVREIAHEEQRESARKDGERVTDQMGADRSDPQGDKQESTAK